MFTRTHTYSHIHITYPYNIYLALRKVGLSGGVNDGVMIMDRLAPLLVDSFLKGRGETPVLASKSIVSPPTHTFPLTDSVKYN